MEYHRICLCGECSMDNKTSHKSPNEAFQNLPKRLLADRTQLRWDLSATVYPLASYFSVVTLIIRLQDEDTGGNINSKTSPACVLFNTQRRFIHWSCHASHAVYEPTYRVVAVETKHSWTSPG